MLTSFSLYVTRFYQPTGLFSSNILLLKKWKHKFSSKSTKQLYQTLGVNENCEDETLRLAFIHLAKQYHPDSGTPEANTVKFLEIESAYRQIQQLRSAQREDSKRGEEIDEQDIKHTAPQHRRYLNYDVGTGTPSQRQKLHSIEKAQRAVENVMEHRLKKLQAAERNTLVGMDKQRAKDIKTRYGMDRLVEDLIQEAMNKGEFSDLPGMGKPLKNDVNRENPYVDFTTHKLNQVLIDNGFAPEWIQLSKEIRRETEEVQKLLTTARNELDTYLLNPQDERSWKNTLENVKPLVKKLNNKIDKYNLLVPILQKQMLHVNLEVLAEQALAAKPVKTNKQLKTKSVNSSNNYENKQNLLTLFTAIFGKGTN